MVVRTGAVSQHPARGELLNVLFEGRNGVHGNDRASVLIEQVDPRKVPSPKWGHRLLPGGCVCCAAVISFREKLPGVSFSPRTVLITGGNRGIGYAIAEEFVALGHRVAVTSRSGSGGPDGVLTVAADVTDTVSIDAAFTEVEEELGPVEVVVANAGINKDTLLLRMSEEDFESVIDTNLTGVFRVVKRASKGLLKAKWGRVILISSVAGVYGSPGQINYAASKSGLIGFARSLTRELGSRGITANVITPGYIETDMTGELSAELQEQYAKQSPVGRAGKPEEVAKAVAFLASDDAAYISGAIIPVDGGVAMGH